jgi:hypothetical protein
MERESLLVLLAAVSGEGEKMRGHASVLGAPGPKIFPVIHW